MIATPAKINLLLEVGALRKSDRRHEIRTLFLPVPQLTDEVEVTKNPAGRGLTLECRGRLISGGATPEENLACRAVRAFAETFGLPPDFHVFLRKRIPISAGLGGGSSDAGAALLEMCRLAGLPPTDARLVPLAASLGADVAFFLNPTPALGTGVGEILQPVEIAADYELVIAYPGCPSPVAWAYQHWQRPDGLQPPAWPPSPVQLSTIEGLASLAWNDLGFALERKLPFLTMLRNALRESGALAAAVSGSGSSVFGLARHGEGDRIRRELRPLYPEVEFF